MTWRSKFPLVRILKGVAAALTVAIMTVFAPPAHANWGEMAMVSETMGISDSRICIGEGSRGDLGCPSYAPTISPTGRINANAGLTVDSVSLTTTGTTWGYLGSTASLSIGVVTGPLIGSQKGPLPLVASGQRA